MSETITLTPDMFGGHCDPECFRRNGINHYHCEYCGKTCSMFGHRQCQTMREARS